MKLHQKGWLLVALSRAEQLWDSELIPQAMREYGLDGRYWINSLSVALDELAAAGLVSRCESRLDDGRFVETGRLQFCYRLTEFGRTRMRDTGLLSD